MAMSKVLCFERPGGQPALGVLAKRAYVFRHGSRAEPTGDAPAFHDDPEYVASTSSPGVERLAHDTDRCAFTKAFTDVLLRGCASSCRGPLASLETGVCIGAARKAVRATGDRRIVRQPSGALGFSAPEPFTRMPITWDLAYGGRDAHAEERIRGTEALPGVLAYPRNYAGRGYFLDMDAERVVGTLAPNLDDASDPVLPERLLAQDELDWIDRPTAAAYEPIDWFTFPRAAFLIRPDFRTPTRPIHEVATGGLRPDDLLDRDPTARPDPRLFNSAPSGLALCRLAGGERVSLWNLHPRHELLEFELPADPPRMVLEPPGAGARELVPALQTVLLEPDIERVTLTWTGAIDVAAVFPAELTEAMPHSVLWTR